jgi:hypothetical protein
MADLEYLVAIRKKYGGHSGRNESQSRKHKGNSRRNESEPRINEGDNEGKPRKDGGCNKVQSFQTGRDHKNRVEDDLAFVY